MKVMCIFDDEDYFLRYNNFLVIENGSLEGEVKLTIKNKDGSEESVTAVKGLDLIKAVENALHV